ncbi:MAG: biotin/lipoyl-binding protein [Halanaerobiales bacterium]|nr:biotin/lipoyl-binding protein [Halanaerobiales bacterium]
MKKYHVKVDQEEYIVQIRLIEEEGQTQVESKSEIEPQVSSKQVDGEKIEAPLGGTILKVNVKVGDQVKAGDVLLLLEALKLENEISAPFNGKVLSILINEGASVELGETLLIIEKQ